MLGSLAKVLLVTDDDPKRLLIWRAGIGVSILAIWAFIWWAVGAVPAFGQGFAKAGDVKGIKVQLLEQTIFDLRVRQCGAASLATSQYYLQRIAEKQREYREIAGAPYDIPTCDDLGISRANP